MASDSTSLPVVTWDAAGTPFSPRFGDIFRNAGAGGGLAQARHVFLRGCGLLPSEGESPAAWRGAAHWAILETGFGLGINFLATWLAWRCDPVRPERLFYTAVEAWPPTPDDLIRSAAPYPELAALARRLARQWHGLVPGFHRLAFERERVVLTLVVGDVESALAQLVGAFDSLFLDGFTPERNPKMWSDRTLAACARLARPGARAATWCVAGAVRERLAACGFEVKRVAGLPPKRHALRARHEPRGRDTGDTRQALAVPGRTCVVIGGGLAGASAAWSLAQRGWRVLVVDRTPHPARGASGVAAGIFAPHVSPDDAPLSRLTRAGIRALLARARLLLGEGQDYAVAGVLELHAAGKRRLPSSWESASANPATAAESGQASAASTPAEAGFATSRPALWHREAGWMRPARLIDAMLQTPGITWLGSVDVTRLERAADGWRVFDAAGHRVANAHLVVLAAGIGSSALLPSGVLPLQALRGQIACGTVPARAAVPPFPVNGDGYFIGNLPGDSRLAWVAGSSFERDRASAWQSAADHVGNLIRLGELLPDTANALAPEWRCGRARAWAGVRATLPDHLPAVGAWPASDGVQPDALPLQLCTGFGSRGLALAVLCGEVLAASLHAEPLPISAALARQIAAGRFARRNKKP